MLVADNEVTGQGACVAKAAEEAEDLRRIGGVGRIKEDEVEGTPGRRRTALEDIAAHEARPIAAEAQGGDVALDDGGGIFLFAALVYALTMLLEYTMSTLYHAIAVDRAKRVFKVLDHSCIYLFIAGSYTPFCLISLADSGGVWLCAFVWLVALAGVACEAFWVFRPRWVSAVLYLLMGWCVVWFLPALIEAIPGPGLWLLVGGGICYSIGCIFYVLKKVPYMHSLFHLWVLAGSVLQFLAISLYVM